MLSRISHSRRLAKRRDLLLIWSIREEVVRKSIKSGRTRGRVCFAKIVYLIIRNAPCRNRTYNPVIKSVRLPTVPVIQYEPL
jgi:hypothetical protein